VFSCVLRIAKIKLHVVSKCSNPDVNISKCVFALDSEVFRRNPKNLDGNCVALLNSELRSKIKSTA